MIKLKLFKKLTNCSYYQTLRKAFKCIRKITGTIVELAELSKIGQHLISIVSINLTFWRKIENNNVYR